VRNISSYGKFERMRAISRRLQIALVIAGYAFVFAVSSVLVFIRYLHHAEDPAAASGGMDAAGDCVHVPRRDVPGGDRRVCDQPVGSKVH
jgi:hypothetical protein